METIQGSGVSELWAVGLLVNADRLFNIQGFSGFAEKELDVLSERLKVLPQDAVKTLAETMNTAKARAAFMLIKEDWLFGKDGFREPDFQEGLKLLKEAIARGK